MPPSFFGCDSPLLKTKDDDIQESRQQNRIKCVLVGDSAVGKTSLVVSYSTNEFPLEYQPTAFDNYNVVVNVDGHPVSLQLCDTAGQDGLDPLRSLCLPETDVFLVCFSVVSPGSFRNVSDKWLPLLRNLAGPTPWLLVGTQSDRRRDVHRVGQMDRRSERAVNASEARRLARILGAVGYVETSALTQRHLKEAFDLAILSALEFRGHSRLPGKDGSSRKGFWHKLCCFS